MITVPLQFRRRTTDKPADPQRLKVDDSVQTSARSDVSDRGWKKICGPRTSRCVTKVLRCQCHCNFDLFRQVFPEIWRTDMHTAIELGNNNNKLDLSEEGLAGFYLTKGCLHHVSICTFYVKHLGIHFRVHCRNF